ncbi:MAG: AIM24 family protein, partial [Actinomycetota bacterium]|nr:AIM24 family protein [Actinomycetota bacterium]
VHLSGETFYAESESLLAYDGRLRSGTQFLGNSGVGGLIRGAATGSGLFTTTLTGSGELAIVSDGDAIALDVTPDRPVFVDPQAYIGHRGQLRSDLVTDVGWKTFVGQSSGESYQLKFTGGGTVYIQAAERGGNR